MEPENRIYWIDNSKAVGILLVILGHVYIKNDLRTWIYSFHMPLFFFLSGYLFSYKKYYTFRKLIESRVKSILIPYFSFALISYIYWFLLERHFRTGDMGLNVFRLFLGIFIGNGKEPNLHPNIVLWFLPCLFTTQLLFLVILKTIKKEKLLIPVLVVFSVIGFLVSKYYGDPWPWSLNITLTSVVFFGIGFVIKNSSKIIFSLNYWKWISIGMLLLLNILFIIKNGMINMIDVNFGKNIFYFYITSFSGIFFLILLCQTIMFNHYLLFLGQNSLIIMLIHEPVKRIVIKAYELIFHNHIIRNNIVHGLIITGITVALLIPIVFLINSYTPFLAGNSKTSQST